MASGKIVRHAARDAASGCVVRTFSVVPDVLVRPVASPHRKIHDRHAELQKMLAAGEIPDERAGLAVPCHIPVDVGSGEILRAGHAELRGRACERVPHEMVDSVRKGRVANALYPRGID